MTTSEPQAQCRSCRSLKPHFTILMHTFVLSGSWWRGYPTNIRTALDESSSTSRRERLRTTSGGNTNSILPCSRGLVCRGGRTTNDRHTGRPNQVQVSDDDDNANKQTRVCLTTIRRRQNGAAPHNTLCIRILPGGNDHPSSSHFALIDFQAGRTEFTCPSRFAYVLIQLRWVELFFTRSSCTCACVCPRHLEEVEF